MFIKTTSITTTLATLLACSAPVMDGDADLLGNQWGQGQHANVPGSQGERQHSGITRGVIGGPARGMSRAMP